MVITAGTAEASAFTASKGGFLKHSGVMADSALAMFLVGLAVGVPLGIALFFSYLMMREKQETEQDRQVDELLASLEESDTFQSGPWSGGSRDESSSSRQRLEGEATEENREPWERPTDWWRES